VELLVAMALTLFIMSILSQAFISGMETFRQLKAVGDLNGRLRIATAALRNDLRSIGLTVGGAPTSLSQFPVPAPAPTGAGFFRIWQDAPTTTGTLDSTGTICTPASMTNIVPNTVLTVDSPNEETVSVINTTGTTFTANFTKTHSANFPIVLCEGSDADGVPSVQSTTHSLHFTVNLGMSNDNLAYTHNNAHLQPSSPTRENYFSAKEGDDGTYSGVGLPTFDSGGFPPFDLLGPPAFRDSSNHVYNNQWAEVAYFLVPEQYPTTGGGTPAVWTGGAPGLGQPLYNLYRRLQVIATDQPVVGSATVFNNESTTPTNNQTQPPRLNASKKPTFYYEISARPDPSSTPAWNFLFFNLPEYLTIPERRFGMSQATGTAGQPIGAQLPSGALTYPRLAVDPSEPQHLAGQLESSSLTGADLLLTDVISFDVQVFMPAENPNDFINIPYQGYVATAGNMPPLYVQANNNSNITGKRIYDTWSQEPLAFDSTGAAAYENPYDYSLSATQVGGVQTAPFGTSTTPAPAIVGLKITLRIWDVKTQKARQITIIQDM
jgi:hypothetical protein